jgi:hypothetical protein
LLHIVLQILPPDIVLHIVHHSAPRYRLRKLASVVRGPLWRCYGAAIT